MDKFLENKYLDFTETDFINDPFFQELIINPTTEAKNSWEEFLERHPHKKEVVEKAKLFLSHLHFEEEFPDDSYIHRSYLKHLQQVRVKQHQKTTSLKTIPIRRLVSIAAFIGGIMLFASIIFYYEANKKVSVETRFGEIKKVSLPDGSEILLNGHSNVRFRKSLSKNKPREIWLEGEAFFNVMHLNKNTAYIKPDERFIVHGEDFTIEVLGTSFDVRQRRSKTEVVLQTGKIKLTLKNGNSPEIIMQPGDLIVYNRESNSLVRSTTNPQNYTGWKEKKLMLNNPTLQEIINYLEDNYGKKIILEGQKIGTKKIEGPIELNNLNNVLFIISTVLDVDVEQKGNMIFIRSK